MVWSKILMEFEDISKARWKDWCDGNVRVSIREGLEVGEGLSEVPKMAWH